MKIVFVTDLYFPAIGGVEQETRRMAKRLLELGHDVSVVAPSKGFFDKIYIENGLKVYGIKSVVHPIYKTIRFVPRLLAPIKINTVLNAIKPEIIHIQTSNPLAWAASIFAKRHGIATVSTAHYAKGELDFNRWKPMAHIVDHFARKSFEKVWKNTHIVTFPSFASMDYFYNHLDRNNEVLILSNGIEKVNPFLSAKLNRNQKSNNCFECETS